MKLKEKFLDHVYCFMGSGMLTNTYDEDIANWNAEKCEIIADDFASEFSDWVTINYPNQKQFLLKRGNLSGFYTTKQLLEIYKKENKL